MKSKEVITSELRHLLPELRRQYPIRRIGLFGSYARNEATEESDLDLLVDFDAPMTLFRFCELEACISDSLGIKTDLVQEKALRPRIARRIQNEVEYL